MAQTPTANHAHAQLIRNVAGDLAQLGKTSSALAGFKVETAIKGDAIVFSYGVETVPAPHYAAEHAAWASNGLRANPALQEAEPSPSLLTFTRDDAIDLKIQFLPLRSDHVHPAPFHVTTLISQGGTVFRRWSRTRKLTIDDRQLRGPASAALRGPISAIVEARVKAYLQALDTP